MSHRSGCPAEPSRDAFDSRQGGPHHLYSTRAQGGSALSAFLNTRAYRAWLFGLVAFCLFVAAMVLALRGDDRVRRGRYAIPPGQAYHVRASGETVPLGGAVLAPATPVATH